MELRIQILLNVEDLDAVRSLVFASPEYHQAYLSTSFAPTVNIEAGNLDQGLLDIATASKELVVIHCEFCRYKEIQVK